MPWNNQNSGGGGWKSGGGGGPWGQPGGGGGGPWGSGSQGGGGQQPDLEEILKRSQDKMKQAMGGGPSGLLLLLAAAAALAVVVWYACTFTVKPDEVGVVLRFGKYDRQAEQGLHFKYPYPIEEVLLPKVTRENSIQIGLRSATRGRFGSTVTATDVPEESLMLTGDENIIDVDFVVFWRIDALKDIDELGQSGVEQYLFNIQNPEATVKVVAESAMREIVGKSDLQPILTQDRQKTETAVRTLMQETLDSYGAGINVTQVQLQKVDPPSNVIDAFRDVQAARADQARLRNEAQAYANRVVPEARGEAERILQRAQAYKKQVVEEAKGQASRFDQVFAEYSKAPDVTRQRMFLETMERIFEGTDKIILNNSGSGQGVVPYLPLNELRRPSGSAAAATTGQ